MINKYPYYSRVLANLRDNEDILLPYHARVVDYMSDSAGVYNPSNIHRIRDSYKTGRMSVDAASIELGIGTNLAAVAQFANMNNLGTPNKRVGVSYFFNIGSASQLVSGVVVGSGLYADEITASGIVTNSGVIENCIVTLSTSSSSPTSGLLHGNNYISKMHDTLGNWYFDNGTLLSYNPYTFFNGLLSLSTYGTLNWLSGNINVDGSVLTSNLILSSDASLSGIIDTFNYGGISEGSGVIYSFTGHAHDGSNWTRMPDSFNVLTPVIDEGSYQYSFTLQSQKGTILRSNVNSNNSVLNPFVIIDNLSLIPDGSLRLDVNGDNWAVFGSGGFIYNSGGQQYFISNTFSRGVVIDSDIVYYSVSPDDERGRIKSLRTGQVIAPSIPISNTIETQRFGNISYFIDYTLDKIYTYYSGKTTTSTHSFESKISASTIWKGQLILLYENGNIYRFSNGKKIYIGSISTSGSILSIRGVGAVLYALSRDSSDNVRVDAFGYNKVFNMLNYNPILESTGIVPPLVVYGNVNWVYVQLGSQRSRIKRNVSSALSFDSVDGIMFTGSNISVNGEINIGTGILSGLTSKLPYRSLAKIGDVPFFLDKKDGFPSAYLTRYFYENTNWRTYWDITSSIVYGNSLILGHRGSVSIFDVGTSSFSPMIEGLDKKIISRFIPTNFGLYALSQDFSSPLIDTKQSVANPETSVTTETNHIPNFPVSWDAPVTKILVNNGTTWNEVDAINKLYTTNIIDSIGYNDSIYILSQVGISGISCYIHSTKEIGIQKSTNYNISLNLKEEYIGTLFVVGEDGTLLASDDSSVLTALPYFNTDFNKFLLGGHPSGPYVVHMHTEVLTEYIGPSGVQMVSDGNHVVDNTSKPAQYNYDVIDVTFVGCSGVSKTLAKIILGRDVDTVMNSRKNDPQIMRELSDSANRVKYNLITTFSHNSNIYIVVQTDDRTLSIYEITDLHEYEMMTPGSVSTIFGKGLSIVGDPIERTKMGDSMLSSFVIPYDPSCYLKTRIDLGKYLGIREGKVSLLGDQDDVFLNREDRKDYRLNRRYATASVTVVENRVFIPLSCRTTYGKIRSLVLILDERGNVYLSGKKLGMELCSHQIGRAHFSQYYGSLFISALKLAVDSNTPEFISVQDILADVSSNSIMLGVSNRNANQNEKFNTIYNYYGNKTLLIGLRDITLEDILNIKERF